MENTIFVQAAKFLRERRNNRRWRITVCCLAVFVVCGTAWALSRNGQAFVSSGAVLDCPMVVHEHTSGCFNEEGRQICGEADYVFHIHDDYCYDMDGQLVCELEEVEEHEHAADCFETITTLSCGYGTVPAGEFSIEETNVNSKSGSAEGETLVCGMEEHTHSDDCYGQGERRLICGQEEGGHTHDDRCYDEEVTEGKLTCDKEESEEEDGHTHNSDCYEKITETKLVCGQEEGGHEHSAACYGETGEIVQACGMEEHTHSEACYENQQGSGDGADVEEPESHVHDETCTRKVRKLVCGKKGAHIHSSEECYYGGELICEVPAVRSVEVHTHDKKCFRTGEDEEFVKIYRDDEIIVTAVYTGLAQIPEAAALRVEMISEDSSAYKRDLAKLTETEGALVEDSSLAMLLQIGFYTTDERIRPKDTVHFTVQFLNDSLCEEGDEVTVVCFADGGVELIAAADIDDENATEFDLEEFADLDIGIIIGGEHDRKRVLTYEGAGYIMSIALEEDTKISKDAELTIDRLTQENSPEGYAERLAQLEETDGILAGEDDMAMLLRVWISDNGTDTGLEERAEVSVQFLDDKIYAEGDAVMMASFADDGVRLISGTDIDEERTTTFEVEELSELAFLAPGERADVLTYEGEDYIVTVALGADTRVPEGAELMVEEITKESDPALYAERLDQLESVDGMLGEEERIAHLLHMWVALDGEEIDLDETMEVTVQFVNSRFYFEGDAVKAAQFTEEDGQQYLTMLDAADIDADISTNFVSEGLNDFAFVVDDAYTMVYEGDDFVVTVRFKDAAKIPEDAELIAKRITEESDPEEFTAREDQLQDEITDELIALGALFEIGFYDAGGEEIEPQDVVDVKIRLLDRKTIEEADSVKVAHFVTDAEKEGETVEIIKEVEVTEDGDGSLSTSFQTESFSTYAITFNGVVDSASALRKAVKLAQEQDDFGPVTLMDDIVFYKKADEGDEDDAMPINVGKSVTLDLNGYTITVDSSNGGSVTLFNIEGNLDIKDSPRAGVTRNVTWNAEDAKAPTFIYDNSNNLHHLTAMTCSVTESQVKDPSRGATEETTYTYTVTGHGAIVGTNKEGKKNESPLLYVKAGELNISGGVIVGDTGNRAVEMRYGSDWHAGLTATMTLDECYLVGCTATKSYAASEISGGAVYCGDSGEIYINNDAIISGNEARRGGGIYVTSTSGGNSLVKITGGYITNNTATFNDSGTNYGDGGGGIDVNNAAIEMTGGYITGNKAHAGGAGIALSGRNQWRATKIVGGTIASNYCVGFHGEGGGIALYDKSIIEINGKDANGRGLGKVYITNNEVQRNADWGGGGLFVGRDSSATLFDTLITGNSADGFGGGLGGCSTGRIVEVNSSTRGAAIFDNSAAGQTYAGDSTKNEDYTYSHNTPTFWERDDRGRYYFQDLFSVLFTTVDNTMLGEGIEHWDGTVDGVRVNANQNVWQSSYLSGLTAFPTEEAKKRAESLAAVYINGNHSAVHGGGIMCNGIMVIGQNSGQIEIITAMELTGTKGLIDSQGNKIDITEDQKGQFSFSIYSEDALIDKSHKHGPTCQNADGKYVCGLEEGEPVFMKHEHIPPENKDGVPNPDSCYKKLEDTAGGKKWELTCKKGIVATGKNGADIVTKTEINGDDMSLGGNGTVSSSEYDPKTISFDSLLTFDLVRDIGKEKGEIKEGEQRKYVYYIKEDDMMEQSANVEIARDPTVYRMEVIVEKKYYNKISELSNIDKYYDDIVEVKVYKASRGDNGTWSWSTEPVYTQNTGLHDQYHAIKIDMDNFNKDDSDNKRPAFTNKEADVKRIEVDKAWAGFTEKEPEEVQKEIEWVSVALFKKGTYAYYAEKDEDTGETLPRPGELVQYGRRYLRNGDWTASWEWDEKDPDGNQIGLSLDKNGDGIADIYGIEYEVREIDIKYTEDKYKNEGEVIPEKAKDRIEPATWVFAPKYEYANDGKTTAKVTVTNIPKTFGFLFTKVGYDKKAIYGAKFQICKVDAKVNAVKEEEVIKYYSLSSYTKEDWMQFQQISGGYAPWDDKTYTDNRTTDTLTTNIKGEIKVSGLPEGYYLIKEIEAPVGYKPVKDHIIHLGGGEGIAAQKVICLSTMKDENHESCREFVARTEMADGEDASDFKDKNMYFGYVDDVLLWRMEDPEDKYELPKTGGLGKNRIFIFGTVAFFGIVVVTYTTYRRRREGLRR